jgi:GGDEF domain-containing protein
VEGDTDELGVFRRGLNHVAAGFTESSGADTIVLGLGAAIHALEEYNRRASRGLKAYSQELKVVLTMMGETISFLGASGQTGVEKLHAIEKTLAQTADATDVRLLRDKLSDCLKMVRNESVRMRSESQQHLDSLKSGIARTTEHLQSIDKYPPVIDVTTGLPARRTAEQSIAGRLAQGSDFAIALFMVDRLPSINARFGLAAGDQTLMMAAQNLAQRLGDVGTLMRWSGPGFVAILEIKDGLQRVERYVKDVANFRLEMEINTSSRNTLLPITCSWLLHKTTSDDAVDAVFQKLDECLISHGGFAG